MRYLAFAFRLALFPVRLAVIPVSFVFTMWNVFGEGKDHWFSIVDFVINLGKREWKATEPEWEKTESPNDHLLRPL